MKFSNTLDLSWSVAWKPPPCSALGSGSTAYAISVANDTYHWWSGLTSEFDSAVIPSASSWAVVSRHGSNGSLDWTAGFASSGHQATGSEGVVATADGGAIGSAFTLGEAPGTASPIVVDSCSSCRPQALQCGSSSTVAVLLGTQPL